jgi:hypothetical protein
MQNPLPPAAQARHLTEALRRAGVLADASVREVAVESTRTVIMSRIIRLRMTYDRAAPDAPGSLILKAPHPDRVGLAWTSGRQEVAFYRQVAAVMTARLMPRCFDADWDAATGDWHLLLEDLTDSHAIPLGWPLPPGEAQCARIVEARARFHAAWWDDARLGIQVGTLLEGAVLEAVLLGLAQRYAQFVDRFGDVLPRERRALYEHFLATAPRLMTGGDALRNRTVVQGDAHVWNCFLPRDGGDDVRLFDWDGWRIDVGVCDIAHMMVLHWYPDRRARLEKPLLNRYHEALLAHGVLGYDRSTLDADYRAAALRQIMVPLWQAVNDIPPVIWWNSLERVLMAVDDLGCRELLG